MSPRGSRDRDPGAGPPHRTPMACEAVPSRAGPGRPGNGPKVLFACALTLSVVAGACQRGSAIHVASVRADPGAFGEPLREVGLDLPALEMAAQDSLASAGFKSGEGRRTFRARLEVASMRLARDPAGGAARVQIAVGLELVPVERGAPAERSLLEAGVGSALVEPGRAASAWREALGQAARDAAARLSLALREQAKPIERLIADLDSGDAAARDRAIQALGDRRNAAAVPALIERLRDSDPEVVRHAVGALAQIRDPRAVGPLIDASRQDDGAFTARLARIIGDIGGSEARGYLLTLQAGHPDPRVQAAAGEALEEMDAREEEAARVAGK